MSELYITSLFVEAPPEVVFDHFTKAELLVRWMGDHARLSATDGGLFSVDINGVLIRGNYVSIDRPSRLEISWGEAGNRMMPPASTRLVVTLTAEDGGTRLRLEHSGLVPEEAAKHSIGWPHFLRRLAILAAGGDPGSDPFAKAR